MFTVNLVKEIHKLPDKPKKYRGQMFDLKNVIGCIHNLFYNKDFIPISTRTITESIGVSEPGQFVYKFIRPNLINKNLIENHISKNKNYIFYPAGIILKYKETNEVFFPDHPDLSKLLLNNSDKIIINICEQPITLKDFLNILKKDNTEQLLVVEILLDIAKKCSVKTVYSHEDLKNIIGNELTKKKFDRKIKWKIYKIGNLAFDFIKWYGTGEKGEEFTCNDITCEYKDIQLEIPIEMQPMIRERLLKKQQKAHATKQVFDNNPGYRLIGIENAGHLFPEINARKLQLKMFFGPTDFYTSVATNQSVNEEFEDEYKQKTSIKMKYVLNQNLNDPAYLKDSKLANMFGIALATITSDKKILLQSRSNQVFMGKNRISLATAENMIKDLDVDKNKNPDMFKAACRCLKEEIRVEVKREECIFLAVGIRLDNFLPQALGIVRIKEKSSELDFMTARDSWEGTNFAEDFTFEALKPYFEESSYISSTAKLTILLALINEYGFEEIKEKVKSIA